MVPLFFYSYSSSICLIGSPSENLLGVTFDNIQQVIRELIFR